MSENSTPVQESFSTGTFYGEQPAEQAETTANYEEANRESSLQQALDEKSEVESIKDKISELEGQSEEESIENSEEDNKIDNNKEIETKKEDEFSSKFAALSRREKALREKESALEAKLSQIEERLQMLDSKSNPIEPEKEPELPLEYRLKKDPLAALAEMGLSFDKLTQLALNDGKLTPEMQMELMRQEIDQKYSKEIETLRAELVEKEKKVEEEKYNEVVQNFKSELTNFVNDTDTYELIRANDAVEVVYEVIEKHYQDTGRILSKKEAADQVESYLEEEVEKLLKLNKLKSKLGAQQPSAPTQSTEPKLTPKAPTLSNAHSAVASKPSRQLTREESIAQAAAMLKWND